MLIGTINGNTITVNNGDITLLDGKNVLISVLEKKQQQEKDPIDILTYVKPCVRADFANDYIKGLRNNDRF